MALPTRSKRQQPPDPHPFGKLAPQTKALISGLSEVLQGEVVTFEELASIAGATEEEIRAGKWWCTTRKRLLLDHGQVWVAARGVGKRHLKEVEVVELDAYRMRMQRASRGRRQELESVDFNGLSDVRKVQHQTETMCARVGEYANKASTRRGIRRQIANSTPGRITLGKGLSALLDHRDRENED